MNIVVLHDNGIEHYKSWSEVKKYTSFKKNDFAQLGTDYVLNSTGDTFEISKDIKLLETVASQKVFSKDKFDTTNWLQVIILVMLLFMMTS
jgi:hypothetical protein